MPSCGSMERSTIVSGDLIFTNLFIIVTTDDNE